MLFSEGGTLHGTIPAHGCVLCTLQTAHYWAIGLKFGSKSVLKSHTGGERDQGKAVKPLHPVHKSYFQPSFLTFPNTNVLAMYLWSTCFHFRPCRKQMGFSSTALKRCVMWLGQELKTQKQLNTKQYMFRCQMSRQDRGTFPDAPFGNTGSCWSFLWPTNPRSTSVWGDMESASSPLFPQCHCWGPLSPKLSPSLAYRLHKVSKCFHCHVLQTYSRSIQSEHLLNWADVNRAHGQH